MNVVETLGAVAAGIITIAIVALIVKPNSSAPKLVARSGTAFASSIKAATLQG